MKPPTIVGFDAAERTVTLQFAEDIRDRGFTIGAEFGCSRNQNTTQFCHEAEENAHLLAKAREEGAIRGLTLATLCDMLLGEDATDRSDDALVRAAWKLKQDLERFTGGGLLDCHAICDQRDAARAENHALRGEVARLKQRILDDNKAYGCEVSATCINHNDAQPAAAGCPVCLQAENATLKMDKNQLQTRVLKLAEETERLFEAGLVLSHDNIGLRTTIEKHAANLIRHTTFSGGAHAHEHNLAVDAFTAIAKRGAK